MSEQKEVSQIKSEHESDTTTILGIEYEVPPAVVISRMLPDPDGPLGGLHRLRVNQNAPFKEVAGTEENYLAGLKQRVAESMAPVRDHLAGLLKNRIFLEKMSENRNFLDEIDVEKLKKITGMNEGYENIVFRMYLILTRHVDPEIIPVIIAESIEDQDMGIKMAQVFESNYRLILSFVTLLTDETFLMEFRKSRDFDGYSDAIDKKITDFLHQFTGVFSTVFPEESTEDIYLFFTDFFNLNGELSHYDNKAGARVFFESKKSTIAHYFETKYKDSMDRYGDWTEQAYYATNPLVDTFYEYAKSYQKARYFVGVYQNAEKMFQEMFPEIFLSPHFDGLEVKYSNHRVENEQTGDMCTHADGYWTIEDRRAIGIKIGGLESVFPEDIQDNVIPDMHGVPGRRAVVDSIIYLHELAHAIYDERVLKGNRVTEYLETADHAVNEGQAVLLEMLFIDFLIAGADKLGLDEADIKYLEGSKVARLFSLKEEMDGYTEGTFFILHKVYVAAAGKWKNRDVKAGLIAIRDFLSKIDANKTQNIRRDSPIYKEALKKRDPDFWLKLFS